jgi:hypothetical protein
MSVYDFMKNVFLVLYIIPLAVLITGIYIIFSGHKWSRVAGLIIGLSGSALFVLFSTIIYDFSLSTESRTAGYVSALLSLSLIAVSFFVETFINHKENGRN